MREEQEGVAEELPTFVEGLQRGGGLEQDFQVGVITTSVYANTLRSGVPFTRFYPQQMGELRRVPLVDGGTASDGEKVLSGTDPELVSKFARLVRQGTDGSGQETPFEAVRLALTERSLLAQDQSGNRGFLRDGARLLVVVVSDEDDCSESERPPTVTLGTQEGEDYCTEQTAKLRPVGDYYTDLERLIDSAGARREVLWAAIAPVGIVSKNAQSITEEINGKKVTHNVDCPTSNGPGYRQRQMSFLFDNELGNLASICSPNYHDTLAAIAHLAAESQTVEVAQNIPDPGLIVVQVTRADGAVQKCTTSNGGITFEPPSGARKGRVHFSGSCRHRSDDRQVQVKLLCAG